MNRKKTLLVAVVALVSMNAHAGFFLVDGKSRGEGAAPDATTQPKAAAVEPKKKMLGSFTVTRCDAPCGVPIVKEVTAPPAAAVEKTRFKLPLKSSIKAADLAVMREMASVSIVADGSKAGLKKASAIKELIGKDGVSIKPDGAASGFVLIREGE